MHRRSFLRAGSAVGLGLAAPMALSSPAFAAEWPVPRGDEEAALEPALPIVDPHHHLWDVRGEAPSFMFPTLMQEIRSGGHNIQQTVFIECGSMYRVDGPVELRPVGEVEFVNGVAAQSASGLYGPTRVATGIVGAADFTLGDRVRRVVEAQITAGDGRLRGIRKNIFWAENVSVMGQERPTIFQPKGFAARPEVRAGIATLASYGISMDMGCYHTQLQEVADVAAAVPNVQIVLNHMGTPLLVGRYAAKPEEVFADWKRGMVELAKRPNVVVKLGGLGQDWAYPIGHINPASTTTALAAKWEPWIETSVQLFGVDRCMFESNFPVDQTSCSYGAVWNAFKRIAAGYSPAEKAALFAGVARRVYRLPPYPATA
jgi:L-fuconolactonase